jgi:TPR repeat protein
LIKAQMTEANPNHNNPNHHHHHHHHHHHKNDDDDLHKDPRWSPRGIMAMASMFPLAVGPGTAQTAAEKLKVLKIAAGRDKGKSCGKAWYRLGKAHLEGEGTPKDKRQALHCFEMAAERHNVAGALEAGKLLFEGGPGFRQNKERARFFFKLAAEGGVPDAQRKLGELNLSSPDKPHSETLQFFLDAFTSNPIVNAAAGMAAARMLAACMAAPEPDHSQAIRLLEKAADTGSHGIYIQSCGFVSLNSILFPLFFFQFPIFKK